MFDVHNGSVNFKYSMPLSKLCTALVIRNRTFKCQKKQSKMKMSGYSFPFHFNGLILLVQMCFGLNVLRVHFM